VVKINFSLNEKTRLLNIIYKSQRKISIDIKNLSKNIGRKSKSQVKHIYNEDYKKAKKKRVKGKNGNLII
jgi:hypothetical protein